MSRKTGGGPAVPLNVIQDADLEESGGEFKLAGEVAYPITDVSGVGRKVGGGPYRSVYPVTQADVDSGEYKMAGGPAIPVVRRTGNGSLTGAVAAVPVLPCYSKR